VNNIEEGYFYEWPVDKFENRLFMIREILEEFFDDGKYPQLVKEADPFWDPPNPILIGQSFLQLEPLSLMFENNLEASILSIDGTGGKQGTLSIAYSPCTEEGDISEELIPERFVVDKAEELVGKKDMYFKVFIKGAKDLPSNLSCNPFVTYQFKFDDTLYTTEEKPGMQQNPKWAYSLVHKIDDLSKEVVNELKTGNISFIVYAYPPARATMA